MPAYNKPTKLHPGDRALSSQTWNGFVELYEDKYRRVGVSSTPLNRVTPPVLEGSTIVFATTDGEPIGGYQPVRVKLYKPQRTPALSMPIYVVEKVDKYHVAPANEINLPEQAANYGFTMAEGVNKESGGRIVIGGTAVVKVDVADINAYEATMGAVSNMGRTQQQYYMVPDKTLSPDANPVVRKVGHFRILSWFDYDVWTQESPDNTRWLVIDMQSSPEVFRVRTLDSIAAVGSYGDIEVNGFEETDEIAAGIGYPYHCSYASTPFSDGEYKYEANSEEMIRVYNISGAAAPAGNYLAQYSRVYNCFVLLESGGGDGGGGTGVGYMVETGSAGLVSGVAQDLAVYEAANENDLPTDSGTTKRVTHTWATDLGSTIPSNVRMMVVECSDGFSRPIYIDHSWIYNTSMIQRWMADTYTSVINSSHLNDGWGTIVMSREKIYGYGMSSTGAISLVDVLRTGSYNISVQWTGFTHVLDATLRISDQSGALQSQLFNSGTSANGGYMLEENYTVTQAMLNSGGVSLLLEASYAGSSTSGATSWENFTFNVERVGD